ncbi:MAG: CPBP family glutamic-type intramembrane protease [Pigmentiphaga sp.]|uniref:CPBP family glutamic-type intramembrane protease n=1 Tax=Pigmentiphaga sp. TaxID=1977564 RepID=UPI0029B6A8DA|nr:CPBP family glutamic-type intramembrane protease [Pigmentiphaga sp.]MDX3905909.1 CPBP family glutamic-type intramembrane protease [Pigmentiphaga sp.]
MPDTDWPGASAARAPGRGRPGFREEFADFLAFVRRPALGPRLPRAPYGYRRLDGSRPRYASQEWLGGIAGPHLAAWLAVLWGINLLVLGPVAASVATASGAERRLDTLQLSWFHVVLWAPVVEEMLFRFGLRRPATALWLLPVLLAALLLRPTPAMAASVAFACAIIAAVLAWRRYRWPWRWLRRYRDAFPAIFHLSTLAFAFLHLLNFRLGEAGWLLLPLLVLPQWATGLALGWMRVRFGIGTSMAMHAAFNAGPMALLWALQKYAPGWLDG